MCWNLKYAVRVCTKGNMRAQGGEGKASIYMRKFFTIARDVPPYIFTLICVKAGKDKCLYIGEMFIERARQLLCRTQVDKPVAYIMHTAMENLFNLKRLPFCCAKNFINRIAHVSLLRKHGGW